MLVPNPAGGYESLFHSSVLALIVPEFGGFPACPTEKDGLARWWEKVREVPARNIAFFDEKLFYLVAMSFTDDDLSQLPGVMASDTEPPVELQRFLSRLQLGMMASFLPPLPLSSQRRPPPLTIPRDETAPGPSSSTLAPPDTPHAPNFARGQRQGHGEDDEHFPPITPNPFPETRAGEEDYAHVQGITVWEGSVGVVLSENGASSEVRLETSGEGEDKRLIFRTEKGWEVVWQGEVPIAYVRTPIQNPLLSLTASVTLRERQMEHKKAGASIDLASVRNDAAEEGMEEAGGELVKIDLLGGLANRQPMPASRLAPSLQQDLFLPAVIPGSPIPDSSITSMTAPSNMTPSTVSSGPSRERAHLPSALPPSSTTTLRKSYRRVLSLSPGLRVRMRNLVLPQLLPSTGGLSTPPVHDAESEGEGEKRIVLCVEVENTLESDAPYSFEVEDVNVDIAGKGGKATTELVCQPEKDVFPRKLRPVEQYNLLYAVTIASAPEEPFGLDEAVARSLGTGETSRPVSITVIGRPYDDLTERKVVYPTKSFHSRWNCTLDLASYFASQPNSPSHPFSPQHATRSRVSRPPQPTTANAIAGDKRYSLASLIQGEKPSPTNAPFPQRPGSQRFGSGTTQKPLMPSQLVGNRQASLRGPAVRGGEGEGEGLLISVKLLPQGSNGVDPGRAGHVNGNAGQLSTIGTEIGGEIRPLEPFSIEVFVHNRTDEVRRFRLSVPGREGEIANVLDRRRPKPRDGGADDPALRQMLQQYLASASAVIPLENDVRCGPLLPGASLSARMRFLALREGVHRIEKLRVTGTGDDLDFLVSPVLDVVVGHGIDVQ